MEPGLLARRQAEPVARLAAWPAQPRLHPGLDFLIRGEGVLPAHPLPVHTHPGVAHVEDHPEPLNISSGHNPHCRQQRVSRPQDTRSGSHRPARRLPGRPGALLVLVPVADPVVGPHCARRDLSARDGVPAHLTVLYPFLPPERIGPEELADLGRLFSGSRRSDSRWTGWAGSAPLSPGWGQLAPRPGPRSRPSRSVAPEAVGTGRLHRRQRRHPCRPRQPPAPGRIPARPFPLRRPPGSVLWRPGSRPGSTIRNSSAAASRSSAPGDAARPGRPDKAASVSTSAPDTSRDDDHGARSGHVPARGPGRHVSGTHRDSGTGTWKPGRLRTH